MKIDVRIAVSLLIFTGGLIFSAGQVHSRFLLMESRFTVIESRLAKKITIQNEIEDRLLILEIHAETSELLPVCEI